MDQEIPILRTSERNDFKIPIARGLGVLGHCATVDEEYETRRANWARARLKQRYGITAEEFNEMYDDQEGCCAICFEPFVKRPHVDHCHDTGKVRGLLCFQCNVKLAWFEMNRRGIHEYLSPYS